MLRFWSPEIFLHEKIYLHRKNAARFNQQPCLAAKRWRQLWKLNGQLKIFMDNNNSIQISKPPYLLGILCLIPLVGALVGIVMLILGITKYKDKWFSIIGVFGIFFTVAIYSSLIYFTFNGKASQNGFAKISQMQLNSLVKNIEFYKLEKGHYPDKLEELLETDKLAPINDVVQTLKFKKSSLYNYKNLGKTYLLFSSGQDGIANTKDDFYPQIQITKNSQIGYRKSLQK